MFMNNKKRKAVTPKIRLQVITRDNYTCISCGRSPVTNPGLSLEVDHIQPFSKGGLDDLSNFQTLCRDCNRGKGADENLNRILENDIEIIINKINPSILESLKLVSSVRVVSNQEDFLILQQKNNDTYYDIKIIPNTIIGFHTGLNQGIYTIDDNGGQKINFLITKKWHHSHGGTRRGDRKTREGARKALPHKLSFGFEHEKAHMALFHSSGDNFELNLTNNTFHNVGTTIADVSGRGSKINADSNTITNDIEVLQMELEAEIAHGRIKNAEKKVIYEAVQEALSTPHDRKKVKKAKVLLAVLGDKALDLFVQLCALCANMHMVSQLGGS